MTDTLVQRLKDQRKSSVEIRGMTFYFNRPTAEQFARFYSASVTSAHVCIACTTGWSNVTQRDIFGDGSDTPVEYGEALKKEWFVDDEDIWLPLSTAILKGYADYREQQEERVKNSESG